MKTSVESIRDSFDRLHDGEKREAVAEILKQSVRLELSTLDDEAPVDFAEQLFLELDRQESGNGRSSLALT